MSTEGNKSNSDKPKKKTKKKSISKVMKVVVIVLLLIVFIGAGTALGTAYSWIRSAKPLDTEEIFDLDQTTYIVDKEDRVIDKFFANENRSIIPLDEIPKTLQDAFVAIEDKRFYKHNGIDPQRIIGSVIEDLKQGNLEHGASTITQQLIKNVYLTKDKIWKRKIIEMYYAVQLERQFMKEQILEAYLNTIGLGHNVAGVKEAALYYFGKELKDLTLSESAVIAGITNLPTAYSPYSNYEKSMKRRNLILGAMLDQNMISKDEYDSAVAEEIKLVKVEKEVDTTYFADMVIKDVIQAFQEKLDYTNAEAQRKVFNGGLKIVSTIDTEMQNILEYSFNNTKLFPESIEDENGTLQPEAAMVIIDNVTGEIKAVMGGRSLKVRRGLNRATQSPRQPGSAIKPLSVYTPALDNGYGIGTVIDDSPVTFGTYSPNNYDRSFSGLVTVREAIQRSLNVIAVKIVQDVGIERSIEYLQNFGLSDVETVDKKRNDRNLPALALGGMTNGVKPVELAAAYNVFPNKGVYIKPVSFTKVLDRHGNVLLDNTPDKHRVISEQVSYLMIDIMKGVVRGGTGGNAALPNMPVAGKTGTTSDLKDAWFVGYTPYYTAAVWMGHDEPKKMSFTGGSYPAKLWKAVMLELHKELPKKEFQKPDGLVSVSICTESGKRPSELCALDPRGSTIRSELYIKGTEPPIDSICDVHVIKDVCIESNKLASEYCPSDAIQSKVFVQRLEPLNPEKKLPADYIYEAPTSLCDIHLTHLPDENENDEADEYEDDNYYDDNGKDKPKNDDIEHLID